MRVIRVAIHVIPITLLTGIPFVCFHDASATMYRCFDSGGRSVLTDSPAQLQDCTVLDPKTSSPQATTPSVKKPKRVARPHHRPTPFHQQREETQEPVSNEDNEERGVEDAEDTITVPITKIGGSMIVQVLFNGTQDAHLIVDTGASMTVISYDLAIELGLLSGSDVSLNTVNTAGGSVQVSMTQVPEMRVGSAKANNVAVAIHDLPDPISGVSGLLGMSFLKHFKVTLEADRGFLHLQPKSSKK